METRSKYAHRLDPTRDRSGEEMWPIREPCVDNAEISAHQSQCLLISTNNSEADSLPPFIYFFFPPFFFGSWQIISK